MNKTQGSYAMRTMVQNQGYDYDIDDGAYFLRSALLRANGEPMSSLDARKLVCAALQSDQFERQPEVRKNCVRVYYQKGYHVDIPVYRSVTCPSSGEILHYELASSIWKRSDAREVTSWFVEENKRQSPDTTDGRQLRRVVQLLKSFATSRESWRGRIVSGFGISKLISECFCPELGRDDVSFHATIKVIVDRLSEETRIDHPVTPGEQIAPSDDPRGRFLRDKLQSALDVLSVTFQDDCTKEDALKAWDRVFLTDYFSAVAASEKKAPEERFIEELGFVRRLSYNATIAARICKKTGFRHGPVGRGTIVDKGRTIEFKVTTNTPGPYETYWKVRNRGFEAERDKALRGEIRALPHLYEPTAYEGCHYVEVYVVREGVVVAENRIRVKIA